MKTFSLNLVGGAAAVLALCALVPTAVNAAKPSANPACGVSFADRIGDAIRSDDRGAYLHAVDAVECQVWSGGSEDVTLRLGKNTTRRFAVDYRNLALGLAPNPPLGVATDGWFLNVRNIGRMAVLETRVTQASVQAGGDSLIARWCGGEPSNCTFGGSDPGSMLVTVTRTSTSNWVVTTDSPLGGDRALLLKPSRNSYTAVGLYHLPFALEISCPQCR